MLLAAACGKRSLTQVYLWLTRPTNAEPVRVLEQAGYRLVAADCRRRSTRRISSAAACSARRFRSARSWSTARRWSGSRRRRSGAMTVSRRATRRSNEFDPYKFALAGRAGAGQTLYSLSKEGKAGAGPLVTGLTMAVSRRPWRSPSATAAARLPVPMVGSDEAANVCRWRNAGPVQPLRVAGDLPDDDPAELVPGRGGVGREGITKLWSAATVKVYGGGVSEVEFLENVSKLIGDFDLLSRNVSFGGRQGRSTSRSVRRGWPIFAELDALPTGRIVVMASGARPTLAKPTPYWEQPYAPAIEASQPRMTPHGTSTASTTSHNSTPRRRSDGRRGPSSSPRSPGLHSPATKTRRGTAVSDEHSDFYVDERWDMKRTRPETSTTSPRPDVAGRRQGTRRARAGVEGGRYSRRLRSGLRSTC